MRVPTMSNVIRVSSNRSPIVTTGRIQQTRINVSGPPDFINSQRFRRRIRNLPRHNITRLLLFINRVNIFPASPAQYQAGRIQGVPVRTNRAMQFTPHTQLLVRFHDPFASHLMVQYEVLGVFRRNSFRVFHKSRHPTSAIRVDSFHCRHTASNKGQVSRTSAFSVVRHVRPTSFQHRHLKASRVTQLQSACRTLKLTIRRRRRHHILKCNSRIRLHPLIISTPDHTGTLRGPR